MATLYTLHETKHLDRPVTLTNLCPLTSMNLPLWLQWTYTLGTQGVQKPFYAVNREPDFSSTRLLRWSAVQYCLLLDCWPPHLVCLARLCSVVNLWLWALELWLWRVSTTGPHSGHCLVDTGLVIKVAQKFTAVHRPPGVGSSPVVEAFLDTTVDLKLLSRGPVYCSGPKKVWYDQWNQLVPDLSQCVSVTQFQWDYLWDEILK